MSWDIARKSNCLEKTDHVNQPLHHFQDSLPLSVNAVLEECYNLGLEWIVY